ncbi:MAG TPA: hypothetical protein P5519_03850 [Spirochaetia bacterium]|nr:hypothetical protein [Spirochaetales bacterium]HQK33179.1 hypothetical protein [Spirochaetales bacterium]HRS65004.1 hypothetical protein [Spirochaetia bacterium]HRV27513.1 hypothetical protein [Spirochaetia bacterium]
MILMELLHETWDKPPQEMEVELPYNELLNMCEKLYCALKHDVQHGGTVHNCENVSVWARLLYILVPGIINVALNYKICLYYQLPLHPTQYFEVPDKPCPQRYSNEFIKAGEQLFINSIELALALYALSDTVQSKLEHFKKQVPDIITNFVYTSQPDAYTWKGSNPELIKKLADSIMSKGRPSLIIGAAHGALMAGLVLALYLDAPLWFLRFSMFKRKDTGPVITEYDRTYLEHFKNADVLVFDEDSASGQTLRILEKSLSSMGLKLRTGAVIRHGSSGFKPDHVGRVWWD